MRNFAEPGTNVMLSVSDKYIDYILAFCVCGKTCCICISVISLIPVRLKSDHPHLHSGYVYSKTVATQ